MFSLLVIPGILPTRPENTIMAESQGKERAHASMTAKKPQDSHEAASTAFPNDARAIEEREPFAVTQLYERFRRPIHTYVYRLLGNQEDADDVTQEVFIRAFSAWESLYERDNLSAWLYRIATNLCVDLLRRRKRIAWWPLTRRRLRDESGESGLEEDSSYLPSVNGGIPDVAEREHIRLALARMPEEYAIVLVLSAAQGVPYQEIAVIVGISPNAAATRISRAKKMFAEHYHRLSQEGVEQTEKRRP